MFDRFQYDSGNCSLHRTAELIGERWTLLVIREALLGVRRFDDFHRALGCARNLLAARLAKLVDYRVLERTPYREPGSRGHAEYRLTERGLELGAAIGALMQWGDRYLADPHGPPLLLRHRDCGRDLRAALVCDAHGETASRDARLAAGPGAIHIAKRA